MFVTSFWGRNGSEGKVARFFCEQRTDLRPLPGPFLVIRRHPLPQVVDGHDTTVFQPHLGRLPARLVGGGDEGEEAVGVVVFFLGDEDEELVGLVVVGGPGEGGRVEDGWRFGHGVGDCSAKE